MDESLYGTRTARGEWTPDLRASFGPLFDWPTKPLAILRWFIGVPGYLLPWNALYLGVAAALYAVATPPTSSIRTFAVGWIAAILARNLALVVLRVRGPDRWFGSFHDGSPEAHARMKQRLASRNVSVE